MAANSPYDLAVALEYGAPGYHEISQRNKIHDSDIAPRVTIKGSHLEAAWLIKTANQLGIPVLEDDGAATALSQIPLDQEIPEDLYRVVAIILNQLNKSVRYSRQKSGATKP